MSPITTNTKELKQTATEMQRLLKKSQRQLLEVEVALAETEVSEGKAKRHSSAKSLLKSV